MGAWGPGLYSDDFAADLKTTAATLCKLPLSGDEILEILADLNPAASEPADEEHTTFWLVVADQFHRRGVETPARDRAIEIIRDRTNLGVLEELGMSESDLRNRSRKLDELRQRLEGPTPTKERRTIKKPQPLVAEPGEVYRFRVDSQGNVRNPYSTRAADLERFRPAAWGSCLVLSSGHAFDYLAWFQIAPGREFWSEPPSLEMALRNIDPEVNNVGTISPTHLKRMSLDVIERIEPPAVPRPSTETILSVVAADISAANILSRWLPTGTVGA